MARQRLQQLQQTSTIEQYVREFRSLMPELPDMDTKDALFNFVQGLKYQCRLDGLHSHVPLFFKQYQASDWSLYNFCVWMRAVESNFSKVKQKWQSNLNLIKDLNIHRDLKGHVGELIEYSKKASVRQFIHTYIHIYYI